MLLLACIVQVDLNNGAQQELGLKMAAPQYAFVRPFVLGVFSPNEFFLWPSYFQSVHCLSVCLLVAENLAPGCYALAINEDLPGDIQVSWLPNQHLKQKTLKQHQEA